MIITRGVLEDKKEKYLNHIEKGAIFVHPTDTIYGLGCNAKDDICITKLRNMKDAKTIPFSVIAPSKEWIKKNCEITKEAEKWVDKLPGPYTLVLKLKNKKAVSKFVNPDGDTIGVRIPKHWISDYVSELGIPIITTSANVVGEEYVHDLDSLHPRIANNIDFIIYERTKQNTPSDIIHLTGQKAKVIKRSKK